MRKALLSLCLFVLFTFTSASITEEAKETEDITLIDWVKSDSEFVHLEGILVPVDLEGYLESFEIVSKALMDVEHVPEAAKTAFFEELIELYYSGQAYFAFYVTGVEALKEYGREFVHYLILRKEFELAEEIVMIVAHDALLTLDDPQALDLLAKYLRSNLGILSKFLPSINYKFLFSLGLGEDVLRQAFKYRPTTAYVKLKEFCFRAPPDYLLDSGIIRQVLYLYQLLPIQLKVDLQMPLYYRGILTGDEISEVARPLTERDFSAVLLGPFKDLNVLSRSKTALHNQVHLVSKFDPSIIDWFIARVDRTLQNPVVKTDAVFEEEGDDQVWWSRLTTDTVQSEDFQTQNRFNSKFQVFISKEMEGSMIMKNRKVAAYAYSGDSNFWRFLSEAPVEFLGRVVDIVAAEGSAKEFAVFLERADEESIFVLFNDFWQVHRVEEEFVECALMLVNRITQFPRPIEPILFQSFGANKLLKYPKVLDCLQSSGLRIYFDYFSIKAAVLDDGLYAQMRPFQKLFADSLEIAPAVDLQFFWEQAGRFLSLTEMTAHRFLEYYWLKHGFKEITFDLDYFYRSFVFLKRWGHDHPQAIKDILETQKGNLDKVIHEPSILQAFDAESLQLIKAHILFGRSIYLEKCRGTLISEEGWLLL